jgi:hypothetical protein
MKSFRLIFALLSIGLLLLPGCAGRKAAAVNSGDPSNSPSESPEATSESRPSAPVFSAQSHDGGQVLVEVTPLNLAGPEEESLHFQVAMNTHSVDLDYDLDQLSVLRTDKGDEVQASRWDGGRGGHHVNGTLYFPTVDLEGAGWVEVVIRDVAGVPERVLRWELSAAAPGTDVSSSDASAEVAAPQSASGDVGQPAVERPVRGDKVADLYKQFVCSCCGNDIGSCDCGMAEERRAVVDKVVAEGGSVSQVYQAVYQAYGAGIFFDQTLATQAEADLIAQLPDRRPVLEVEPAHVDLGSIPINDGPVSATFTLRNAGQSDLIITGLQTTCGCTTAVLKTAEGASPIFGANLAENPKDWSAVLAAGEEASLVATFDTLFHGPDATGSFQRLVSVISNDPLKARQDVSFVVEVTE